MNIQDWFPVRLTNLISLQSKGLSIVFSSITVQKHQFFSTQLSLWSKTEESNGKTPYGSFLLRKKSDLPVRAHVITLLMLPFPTESRTLLSLSMKDIIEKSDKNYCIMFQRTRTNWWQLQKSKNLKQSMLLHWKRMPKGAINSPSMTGLSRARNASWLDSICYKISYKPVKLNVSIFLPSAHSLNHLCKRTKAKLMPSESFHHLFFLYKVFLPHFPNMGSIFRSFLSIRQVVFI